MRRTAAAAAASALLLVLVAGPGCGGGEARREPPGWNVVFVLVDTLRADHLATWGYDRATSPFLDRLARDAVVFGQARAQAGCTFPSVNSLFTSSWPQPFVEGMKHHGVGIPEGVPTLASLLRDAGMATAAVSASTIVRVNPSKHNPDGGFGAGFDRFDDDCMWKPAGCVNDRALALVDELEEPFFLYLHYLDPHMPFAPPPQHERIWATGYEGKEWVADGRLLPLNSMLYDEGSPVELEERDLAHAIDLYDEEIAYLDGELAELVERLEADGRLDRTLLVLASDHGEELMDHGDLFHCRDMAWDTVLRTPLALWIPGVEGRRVPEALAMNVDLLPTLLDYLAVPSSIPFEGESLRPLIEEGRPVHRYAFGSQRYARTVTDGRFKLIFDIRSEEIELYDLVRDPGELVDLSVRRPERARELMAVLGRWMEVAERSQGLAERLRSADEVTEMLEAVGYL